MRSPCAARGDFRSNRMGSPGVGQARHDRRGAGGDGAGAIDDINAGKRKLAPARRLGVESDDGPAALGEVAGDGAPHDAQSDDTHCPICHVTSSLLSPANDQLARQFSANRGKSYH